MRNVVINNLPRIRYRLLLIFMGMIVGTLFVQAQDCRAALAETEFNTNNKSELNTNKATFNTNRSTFKVNSIKAEPLANRYVVYTEKADTAQNEQPEVVVMVDTILKSNNFLGDHTVIDMYMKTPWNRVKRNKLTWSLKTNLLYAATLTPNLGLEVGLNSRFSLDISGGYNPWNRKGKKGDNDKLVHWLIQPELRYWFCEPASGHFIGIHAVATKYNIGGHKLLYIFDKHYRYEGWGAGAGFTYGYSWMLTGRWGIEAFLGLGIVQLNYEKTDNEKWCCTQSEHSTKTYLGLTKIGVSLIYNIR